MYLSFDYENVTNMFASIFPNTVYTHVYEHDRKQIYEGAMRSTSPASSSRFVNMCVNIFVNMSVNCTVNMLAS